MAESVLRGPQDVEEQDKLLLKKLLTSAGTGATVRELPPFPLLRLDPLGE